MEVYLAVGKTAFYLFQKDDEKFNQIFIDGSKYVKYRLPSIKEELHRLLEKIVDTYNLEGINDLKFIVVESDDRVRNVSVEMVLGDKAIKIIRLADAIKKYIVAKADESINQYGVNYDGETYVLRDNKVCREPFNLLGLRIDVTSLLLVC